MENIEVRGPTGLLPLPQATALTDDERKILEDVKQAGSIEELLKIMGKIESFIETHHELSIGMNTKVLSQLMHKCLMFRKQIPLLSELKDSSGRWGKFLKTIGFRSDDKRDQRLADLEDNENVLKRLQKIFEDEYMAGVPLDAIQAKWSSLLGVQDSAQSPLIREYHTTGDSAEAFVGGLADLVKCYEIIENEMNKDMECFNKDDAKKLLDTAQKNLASLLEAGMTKVKQNEIAFEKLSPHQASWACFYMDKLLNKLDSQKTSIPISVGSVAESDFRVIRGKISQYTTAHKIQDVALSYGKEAALFGGLAMATGGTSLGASALVGIAMPAAMRNIRDVTSLVKDDPSLKIIAEAGLKALFFAGLSQTQGKGVDMKEFVFDHAITSLFTTASDHGIKALSPRLQKLITSALPKSMGRERRDHWAGLVTSGVVVGSQILGMLAAQKISKTLEAGYDSLSKPLRETDFSGIKQEVSPTSSIAEPMKDEISVEINFDKVFPKGSEGRSFVDGFLQGIDLSAMKEQAAPTPSGVVPPTLPLGEDVGVKINLDKLFPSGSESLISSSMVAFQQIANGAESHQMETAVANSLILAGCPAEKASSEAFQIVKEAQDVFNALNSSAIIPIASGTVSEGVSPLNISQQILMEFPKGEIAVALQEESPSSVTKVLTYCALAGAGLAAAAGNTASAGILGVVLFLGILAKSRS